MPLDDLLSEWLELGNQDLQSAEYLSTMRPIPLEVIGFLCQQAVEKHLKAYLIRQDIEPDKTHDLLFLLQICLNYNLAFSAIEKACAQLTKYAVRLRYPYAGEIHEDEIRTALLSAKDACTFISSKITPVFRD